MENKLENTLKARERLLQHPIDASNIRNKTKNCIVSFKLMYHWIYWFLTLNRNSIRPLQLIVLLFVVAMTSAAVNYDSPVEELVGSSEEAASPLDYISGGSYNRVRRSPHHHHHGGKCLYLKDLFPYHQHQSF